MKTLKISYSVLNAWANGNWEQAVGYYLGKPLPPTPAMELGKIKHQAWEHEIKATGNLPADFGGGPLTKPVVERKLEKRLPFSDDYEILLRGILDVRDGGTIIDFKCGKAPASSHVSGPQLDYYKVLVPEADTGIIMAWNPITKLGTTAVRYLDQANLDFALNHIMTHAGEFLQYLLVEKLFVDYDPSKIPATEKQLNLLKKLAAEGKVARGELNGKLTLDRASKLIDKAFGLRQAV